MLTAEQLIQRRSGLGASEIAAVCGASPYATPLDVYLRKLGLVDDTVENDARRAGNMLEPAILSWYAAEMGGANLRASLTLRHPSYEWALATPDAVWTDEPRLVEAKNVGIRMAHEWGDDPDAVPASYMLQTQWQMEVCGYERCDLAVLIGGQTLRIYPQRRDPELCASLLTIAGRFWRNNVLAEVPPPIDGSDGARAYLDRKHPRQMRPMLPAPHGAEELARRYKAAIEAENSALAEKKLCGNILRGMIGDAEGISATWGHVSWKTNKAGTPAWKQIAEACNPPPELIAEHTPSPPRVLRVYPKAK